jgi:hypothetical protein
MNELTADQKAPYCFWSVPFTEGGLTCGGPILCSRGSTIPSLAGTTSSGKLWRTSSSFVSSSDSSGKGSGVLGSPVRSRGSTKPTSRLGRTGPGEVGFGFDGGGSVVVDVTFGPRKGIKEFIVKRPRSRGRYALARARRSDGENAQSVPTNATRKGSDKFYAGPDLGPQNFF